MSAVAILFLVLSAIIVWGGLVVSAVFLGRRPEIAAYPPGGEGDDGDEPLIRDL